MSSLVEVEVRFEEGAASIGDATVYVRLENVSVADAAAVIVAEDVRPDLAYDPGTGEPLRFALSPEALDPTASYSVRVHVDVDGDGQVSTGDFITMESYPVSASDGPVRVSVLVRRVS